MKINIRNSIKKRYPAIIALLSLGILYTGNSYGQYNPADSYYRDNIGGQQPNQNLPSETYYNNHLRAGGDEWEEDDGPEGGGQGGNAGVGVPVGNAGLSVTVCLLIYGIYVYIRKKRMTV